jgi:hypothetical protein
MCSFIGVLLSAPCKEWNECEPEKRSYHLSLSTFRAIRFIYVDLLFSFFFSFKVGYESGVSHHGVCYGVLASVS